ncbi:asparaginase [Halomicrobium salinisoli]|uniref:asparaginase n=1 Tax=Halomicrobium salinisoli TaxID=2878391 RepID=UPI001CEFC27D|nr:asparaginase [Halomicrobium salinisoli]
MPPTVTVLGTGGTIASTEGEAGATPTLSPDALLDAVPEIEEHADLTAEQVAQTPSFAVDFATLDDLRRAVREAAAATDAVVVTHGTDTMEESAYYLDLTLDVDAPVVFTGAQRTADELSADGPANLLTAVRAATDERVRDAGGVYVAFDEALHAARDATKAHTRKLAAFASPGTGPVATFTREDVRFHREPGSRSGSIPVDQGGSEEGDAGPTVEMVKSAVGVDGGGIERAVERGVDGIVLEATGAGNATAEIGDAVAAAIDEGTPVVVTSRSYEGPVAPIYGTPGGGQTLRDHGAIFAGDLPAHKARLKLRLALRETTDVEELRAYFEDD